MEHIKKNLAKKKTKKTWHGSANRFVCVQVELNCCHAQRLMSARARAKGGSIWVRAVAIIGRACQKLNLFVYM